MADEEGAYFMVNNVKLFRATGCMHPLAYDIHTVFQG